MRFHTFEDERIKTFVGTLSHLYRNNVAGAVQDREVGCHEHVPHRRDVLLMLFAKGPTLC